MARHLPFLVTLSLCLLIASIAYGERLPRSDAAYERTSALDNAPDGASVRAVAAAGSTYVLLSTFDNGLDCDDEGWTSHDLTEQAGVYWHVDTYNALDGTKSLWCGNNVASPCGATAGPGYGNNWDQCFVSRVFNVGMAGDCGIQFTAECNTETDHDIVYLEYRINGGDWTELVHYSGTTQPLVGYVIPGDASPYTLQIRFRFRSDYRNSRDDGFIAGGAFILDALEVLDPSASTLSYEDFEAEAAGATTTVSGDWSAEAAPAFGDYAALHKGVDVLQQDLCRSEVTCLWGFFDDPGSTSYACAGYPLAGAVPYGTTGDKPKYITNEIWSPTAAWVGTGDKALLRFSVYRNLPLNELVFYVWHVRWSPDGVCWSPWSDDGFAYYNESPRWAEVEYDVSDYIDPSAQYVQVALGAWDLCEAWCGVFGNPTCHTNAPLFDNVRLIRVDDGQGPVWSVRAQDLFQDNFPNDGSSTGTVSIDRAEDVDPGPPITPGDAAVVTVTAAGGLATDGATGRDAVYLWVKEIAGHTANGVNGIEDPAYPYVGSVAGVGGTWWQFVMDDAGAPAYEVDLLDDELLPGDVVEFYFSATGGGTTSYWSEFTGPTTAAADVQSQPMEMTCLPGPGVANGGDILYVDHADGTDVQLYFDTAFQYFGIEDKVDRYDVRDPAGDHGNGPGGRVLNVPAQLIANYHVIIWSTGSFETNTIDDGTAPDFADDFWMLYQFLENHPDGGGVYFTGDNIACDWAGLSGLSASDFKTHFMNYTVTSCCHSELGIPHSPYVEGLLPGTYFQGIDGADKFVVFGGCPGLCCFDVLQPAGSAVTEMTYDGVVAHGAVLSQATINAMAQTSRVKLEGFSFHKIRDDTPASMPDRVQHLGRVLNCLGTVLNVPVGVGDPHPLLVDRLDQNFPNPFGPNTEIHYDISEAARVRLAIYDAAGRLVRTLVDESQAPQGHGFTVSWDGRTESGAAAATGVYFYRLSTPLVTQTRKMVLIR